MNDQVEPRVTPFGQRLDAALDRYGSLCVGIDPHRGILQGWGLTPDVDGLARFTDICVEAFAGSVAVVKPQSAFFELFGSAGVAVLERAVQAFRAAGTLVILDVKRGDIGSTMGAYAAAYLDPSAPLAADAVTLSPYLGVGSLDPAFQLALRHGNGVFVLALTSNPEGPQVQRARTEDGRTVAELVIDELGERNDVTRPMGSLGVVVGATIGSTDAEIGNLNGPYLVPGIGAQGGSPDDVRRIFGGSARNVVPSVSRSALQPGPDAGALRDAALRQAGEFAFLRA